MSLYEKLGISKDASKDDIKKAFRKLAVTHHPDKGGNEEKFKEISHAY
jgi:curved DNA-binding protein CbpA